MSLIVILSLAFMTGTMIGVYFDVNDIMYALIYSSLVITIKLLLFGIKKRKFEHVYTGIFIGVLLTGIILGKVYVLNLFEDVSKLYGTKVEITGTITECGKNKLVIDSNGTKYSVITFTGEEYPYHENEIIKVKGVLEAHPKSQFNGDMDEYFHQALRNNLGVFRCASVTQTGYNNKISLRKISADFRALINSRIDRYVDRKNIGLVKSLVTGSTTYLETEIKNDFANIGISHLVAVSGLHLGIFLSFFLLITVNASRKKGLKTVLIILIILLYALIIGEKASLFRSAMMVFVGLMFRKRTMGSSPLVNLTVAGMIICFLNPLYITDAGFMLSFCATLGLVMFTDKFKNQYVAVPIIAPIFILPLTIYYYNTISPFCVVANITILLFVPMLILFGYLSCLIPPVCVIVNILAKIITLLSSFMADNLAFNFSVASPTFMHFAEWIIIIIMVYNFMVNKELAETMYILFHLILYISFSSFYFQLPIGNEYQKVKVMNSGTYNTMHITTQDLIDVVINCGPDTDNYLRKSGIKELDAVIITEATMLKDTEDVCKSTKVKRVFLPASLKNKEKNIENSEILYYNQKCLLINHKDFVVSANDRIGYKCLLIDLYDDNICIPINTKKIDTKHSFSVMCVPNGCVDSDKFYNRLHCGNYIHSTYNYKYYESADKYITSKTGGLTMYFYRYQTPYIVYK